MKLLAIPWGIFAPLKFDMIFLKLPPKIWAIKLLVVVLPFVPVTITFFLHLLFTTFRRSGSTLSAIFPGSAVALFPPALRLNLTNLPIIIDKESLNVFIKLMSINTPSQIIMDEYVYLMEIMA